MFIGIYYTTTPKYYNNRKDNFYSALSQIALIQVDRDNLYLIILSVNNKNTLNQGRSQGVLGRPFGKEPTKSLPRNLPPIAAKTQPAEKRVLIRSPVKFPVF